MNFSIYRVYDGVLDQPLYIDSNNHLRATSDVNGDIFYTGEIDALRIKNTASTTRRMAVDFGDGNVVYGLDINHIYKYPGKYQVTVRHFLGDGYTESIYTFGIYVKNLLDDTISFDKNGSKIKGFVTDTNAPDSYSVGYIYEGLGSDVIQITRTNSWQSKQNHTEIPYSAYVYPDIALDANGKSPSVFFSKDDFLLNKNAHLIPTVYVLTEDGTERTEKIYFDSEDVYFTKHIVSNHITFSPGKIEGLQYAVGTTGKARFKFVDESSTTEGDFRRIKVTMDTSKFTNITDDVIRHDKSVNKNILETSSILTYLEYRVLPIELHPNIPVDGEGKKVGTIFITSNGSLEEDFGINPIQWDDVPIYATYTYGYVLTDGRKVVIKRSASEGAVYIPGVTLDSGTFNPDTNPVDKDKLDDGFALQSWFQQRDELNPNIFNNIPNIGQSAYTLVPDEPLMDTVPLAGAFVFGELNLPDTFVTESNISEISQPKSYRLYAEGYRKSNAVTTGPKYMFLTKEGGSSVYRIFKTTSDRYPVDVRYIDDVYVSEDSVGIASSGTVTSISYEPFGGVAFFTIASKSMDSVLVAMDANTGAIIDNIPIVSLTTPTELTSPSHIFLSGITEISPGVNEVTIYVSLADDVDVRVYKYNYFTRTLSDTPYTTNLRTTFGAGVMDLSANTAYTNPPSGYMAGMAGENVLSPLKSIKSGNTLYVLTSNTAADGVVGNTVYIIKDSGTVYLPSFGMNFVDSIVLVQSAEEFYALINSGTSSIRVTDFHVSYDGSKLYMCVGNAISTFDTTTNLAVGTPLTVEGKIQFIHQDGYDRLWVVHGENTVSVYSLGVDMTIGALLVKYNCGTSKALYQNTTTIGGINSDREFVWIIDTLSGKLFAIKHSYLSEGGVWTPTLPLADASPETPKQIYDTGYENRVWLSLSGGQSVFSYGDWTGTDNILRNSLNNKFPLTYVEIRDYGSKFTGVSDEFSVFNRNDIGIDVIKKNESFDYAEMLKDISIQPNINGMESLEDMFRHIYGDYTSDQTEYGKVVYERISNFVENNASIDTSNISALFSMAEQVGLPLLSENMTYPYELMRIMDIMAIKYSKLKGGVLVVDDEYKNIYNPGRNLGKNIPSSQFSSTVVKTGDIGKEFVLYDKFSEKFRRVNCNNAENGDTLADYTKSWGWPVIVDTNSITELVMYYDIYEYVPFQVPQDDVERAEMRVDNVLMTEAMLGFTHDEWVRKNGVVELSLRVGLTNMVL